MNTTQLPMDKNHYWIFNILIEAGCVLPLIDPDQIDWHFYPGHGLDREQLADVLYELLQNGDLIAERHIPKSESVTILPTTSEIESILRTMEPEIAIFLTPQGGQRWEEVSQPHWDRYMATQWEDEGWWGAASLDRHLVERYLELPEVQACVLPGSEVWDIVSPWEATYWKTLPSAQRVRFRLIKSEDRPHWAVVDESWYTNPFAHAHPKS